MICAGPQPGPKRIAGVDTSVIMKLQGWRTDAMFRRYGIVATEDKLDAMQKQEAYEKQLQVEEAARLQKQQEGEGENPEPLQNRYNMPENEKRLDERSSRTVDSERECLVALPGIEPGF